MALTLEDLKEKLIRVDEISLLEILNISSEEIVDRFDDIIEANSERLSADFEDDPDDIDPDNEHWQIDEAT
jgi:hypothetical protein